MLRDLFSLFPAYAGVIPTCFATNCIKKGIDIKTVSETLGHANVNITLNRYVHISFDFKKEQINKMQAPI